VANLKSEISIGSGFFLIVEEIGAAWWESASEGIIQDRPFLIAPEISLFLHIC
jgi:hypothetical protein